jgi:hypothetical protein
MRRVEDRLNGLRQRDPALTDALLAKREVVLLDYSGVGSSTGGRRNQCPHNPEQRSLGLLKSRQIVAAAHD